MSGADNSVNVSIDGSPLTARGERTRKEILDAAEAVFSECGWDTASVSKITARAGVAQGSFYRYFESKVAIFHEVVERFNTRVRQAMTEGAAGGSNHFDSERRGFAAYFRFAEENPRIYRVIRQAEFASPGSLRMHYARIAEGYVANLTRGAAHGEITFDDPEVVAYMLMAIGEMVGQRWILWGDGQLPDAVFEQTMDFIERGLRPQH